MNNKLLLDPLIEQDKQEWLDAIENIFENYGTEGVNAILTELNQWRSRNNIPGAGSATVNTPYLNTIPLAQQVPYPGDVAVEQRLENILRWNAMAMVVQAVSSANSASSSL